MTTNIQKSLRRALQAAAIFTFLFALAMNVNTNVNGTVDVQMETADAQLAIAVPICFASSILVQPKISIRVCKCYRDVVGGPDIFQGWKVNCGAAGLSCRATACFTGSITCYCV